MSAKAKAEVRQKTEVIEDGARSSNLAFALLGWGLKAEVPYERRAAGPGPTHAGMVQLATVSVDAPDVAIGSHTLAFQDLGHGIYPDGVRS